MSQTTPCATCGALLAPDQRYCLGCGTRVAAPRIDFLAETERAAAETPTPVQAPAAVAAAPPLAAPAPSRLDKVGGPMGAAAVVLVALGVGFLIGQRGSDAPPEQRAPVVNIQSGDLPSGDAVVPESDLPAAEGATDGAGVEGTVDDAPTTDAPPPVEDAPADDGSEAAPIG